VEPSVEATDGSKKARLYSFKDILILKLVQRLLDTGVKLQNIRVTVEDLRRRGAHDLARITLFSDGTTVYECTSPEEIVDLLQGGQGVFGISVAGVVKEILRAMADLPLGIAGRDTLSELIKEPTGEMANLFSKEAKLDTAQTFKDSKNMTA
jgi:DNA-binding transcriptional MerR regulator